MVLKLIIIFLLSLSALAILLLLLPFKVYAEYSGGFHIRLYFAGIKIYDSRKKRKSDKGSSQPPREQAAKSPKVFERLRERLGTREAFNYCLELIKAAAERLKKYFRHLRFHFFNMRLIIGTEDAAETAVLYGAVSAAAYPLLSRLLSLTGCSAENIDISADFDNADISFNISAAVSSQLVFLLAAAFAGFCEYKKIRKVTFYE